MANYSKKVTQIAKESMSSANKNLPNNLKAETVVNDGLLNSAGLYSKSVINDAKFSRFSRFGRVIDPYGRLNPGREYLFFVKPDLHICSTNDGYVYKMTGFSNNSGYTSASGLKMNPQLTNNPYFKDLLDTHPQVAKDLQYSLATDDPFCHILSFSVSSSLGLGDVTIETMDNNPATTFGTSYKYLRDSEPSDENYSFSLEFVDDKRLNTYHFFKAYSEYHIARKTGLVTPPSINYYRYKRLHNTMGVYKIIVAEDMETIVYWAYLWGVYPTSCPRDAFSDASFSDGLTFTVSFDAAFIEDMNPMILYQFNLLMNKVMSKYGLNKNKWLPTVRQNYKQDIGSVEGVSNNISYDASIGLDNTNIEAIVNKKGYKASPLSYVDGTLPVAALIDGRKVGNESELKYRLRWYAPEN